MYLLFPNLDTLQLAIISGAASKTLTSAPAAANIAEDGSVWLEPSRNVSKTARGKLAQLGVAVKQKPALECNQAFDCWHHLLPLQPTPPQADDNGEKAVVLFDLPNAELLPELVNEMLRLGNDRQSFRVFEHQGETKVLLRVIGPPYYSLLRATDQRNHPKALTAYVEQASRVWVEVGYRHPLGEYLSPPVGQWSFLQAPRQWSSIEEGKFTDVYGSLEFALPQRSTAWSDTPLSEPIIVALSLKPAGSLEPAELWVLGQEGIEQLDSLVRNGDDTLLSQLSFAVGESEGKRTVVVRARPSKKAPPVLVLSGVACRSYLKLPNLFVPCDRRLHPPLRRDAVAKLLAQDQQLLTWLLPGEDGQFRPESLPDDAFRPLEQWIDYVLEQEHQPLAAWMEVNRFHFESFVCREDQREKAKPPPPKKKTGKDGVAATKRSKDDSAEGSHEDDPKKFVAMKPLAELPQQEPDELAIRLAACEQAFTDLESPLDSPQRRSMWRELGEINAALGHQHDASICFSNAWWETPPDKQEAQSWLESIAPGASKTGLQKKTLNRMTGAVTDVAANDANLLAAYLTWAHATSKPVPAVHERLSALTQFLQNQEAHLPLRTSWLAWTALSAISHGDVLVLARARDRLLERLFQNGLRPEFDLPSFLRSAGGGDNERIRIVRQKLAQLRPLAARWIRDPVGELNARTSAYADLIFAFGLARLGESEQSQQAVDEAQAAIPQADKIHHWCAQAMGFREREARTGLSADGDLSPAMVEELGAMPRFARFKVDRFSERSRIVRPEQNVQSFANWHSGFNDELDELLATIAGQSPDEATAALDHLLIDSLGKKKQQQRAARVLATALEMAPRLGEEASLRFLKWLPQVISTDVHVQHRAAILAHGLLAAAHFDLTEQVRSLVEQIAAATPTMVSLYRDPLDTPTPIEGVWAIEAMFTSSLRALRKLGMLEEAGWLFTQLADAAQSAPAKKSTKKQAIAVDTVARTLKLQLFSAAGWFFFGKVEPAREIMETVRQALFASEMKADAKAKLTGAYIEALGQAPIEYALPAVEELFAFDRKGRKLNIVDDVFSTRTHFSLAQLHIIEALVLALVSDKLMLNAETRRWLDEDEFLVRRRIHRDVRSAMNAAD